MLAGSNFNKKTMDKLFVIAIGGTGMRCLESFVHLCAMGMFDNQTIDILTLDTDQSNGNKDRVESLIDLYNKIKSDDANNINGGQPNAKTFFSAKLKLHKFYTVYGDANRKTYKILSGVNSGLHKEENADLTDLFFDEESVQNFELDHGYRAQTHLGSLLMYHGIIEAARNVAHNGDSASSAEKDLRDFLVSLQGAQNSARVFVFGSIFGGTGASSIPVIPVALRDAINILSDGTMTLNTNSVKFGSTLLTDYFTFTAPDSIQKKADKVIADSNNFALNCQAALQFYQADPTVRSTYKRFYHIGWPFQPLYVGNQGKTITGGKAQQNVCHVVELMCACAAYNFFNLKEEELHNEAVQYLYRSIDDKEGQVSLHGSDFITNGNTFESKLGSLFSLAHIILSQYEAAWTDAEGSGTKGLLSRFAQQNIHDYDSITNAQAKDIDDYFRYYFGYSFGADGNMQKGWIYQIKASVPGRFIFNDEAFKEQRRDMKSISCGHLFEDNLHNWSKLSGLLSKKDNSVDILIKNLSEDRTRPTGDQNVQTTKEKFLAHIHNAIANNQNFNEKN